MSGHTASRAPALQVHSDPRGGIFIYFYFISLLFFLLVQGHAVGSARVPSPHHEVCIRVFNYDNKPTHQVASLPVELVKRRVET